MDRVAGMGDLPVLGALFRSKLFRDQKTELAVLITPSFIDGIDEPSKLRVSQDLERAEQTRQRAKSTLERYRMLD
jgi:Flp pilus assembly secretin CpaC